MGAQEHGCPIGRGDRSCGPADRRLHPGVGSVSRKFGTSCSQRGQLFGTGSANRCHAERTIQAARHRKPFGLRGVYTGGADESIPGVPGAQERRGVPGESLDAGRFGGVKTLRLFAAVEISVARQQLVALTRNLLPSQSKEVPVTPVATLTESCGLMGREALGADRKLTAAGFLLPDGSTSRLVASLFLPMRGCFRARHSDWSGQLTQRSRAAEGIAGVKSIRGPKWPT